MNRPASNPRAVAGHNIPLGEDMSLEECTGADCVANPEAIASLIDGHEGIAATLEQSELLRKRLLDQCRFQHEVLAEIYELVSVLDRTSAADDAQHNLKLISIKSAVALRAAAVSGLLS